MPALPRDPQTQAVAAAWVAVMLAVLVATDWPRNGADSAATGLTLVLTAGWLGIIR